MVELEVIVGVIAGVEKRYAEWAEAFDFQVRERESLARMKRL